MPVLFKDHYAKDGSSAELYPFLADIKDGRYQDQVLRLRNTTDKEQRRNLKTKLPCIMVSANSATGGKTIQDCTEHTGYLIADIDNVPADALDMVLAKVRGDRFTHACFISAGGHGICAIIRTKKWKNEDEHHDCFAALVNYYGDTYAIDLDAAGSNWNRLRAMSYDPDLHLEPNSDIFRDRIKRQTKEPPSLIFGNSDVERVLSEVIARGLALTDTHYDWVRIGASIHSYDGGLRGLEWFKAISRNYAGKYSEKRTESVWRSYKATKATIATLLWEAKRHGVEIISKQTRELTAIARSARNYGSTQDNVKQRIAALDMADPDGIVEQVFNSAPVATTAIDLVLSEQVALYLRTNYDLKRNAVQNVVEMDGNPMTDRDVNSLALNAQRDVSEKVTVQMVNTILESDRVAGYNPLLDYLNSLPIVPVEAVPIDGDTVPYMPVTFRGVQAWADSKAFDLAYHMMLRWGIGMVATVLLEDKYNELLPVLTGKRGDRKTRLVRALVPAELRRYYAEPSFGAIDGSAAKDFRALTTRCIMIMNDEFKGDTKTEAAHFKAMLSAVGTDDRSPYAKRAEKIARIASFIATTNEHDTIADSTGNRRIVPIKTKVMTEEELVSFNPNDLWAEWVSCCKAGVRHYLSSTEGEMLNAYSARYQVAVVEEELLLSTCQHSDNHWATYSEVLKHISLQAPMAYRVNQRALKQALQKHGYTDKMQRDHKRNVWEYPIVFNVPTTSGPSVDVIEPGF